MFSKWSDSSCQTSGWAGISPDTHEWKAEIKETWNSTLGNVMGKAHLGVFWSPFPNVSGNWCGERSTTIFETPEWTKLNLESPSGLPFICSAWHITGLSYSTNICCWKMKVVCNFTYCPVTQDFEMSFPLSNSVNRWNAGHIFLVGEKTY